jgi:hypothetical protein
VWTPVPIIGIGQDWTPKKSAYKNKNRNYTPKETFSFTDLLGADFSKFYGQC